ncbi:arsenate reductase (thioredoxin) [Paenibacillus glufosinatiresistens]|uniref:arsenate reductase (thioredoxin) n=1 Tax=Paenibacillus glufosinatiresistens TaxID=3070657 RepID=UPI00286E898A|nr:arsenate reductase (thioredoxin) [Paenibacillus sp. YX.27]
MNEPLVILFLCTGNSCRSQMAEGFARYYNTLYKGDCEFYSAGLEAHGLNPRAVQVMEEAGVSISHHTSDFVSLSLIARSDIIITLCGHADEHCPVLPPRVKKVHWGFEDPAKTTGSEDEILSKFREVRDLINIKMKWFIEGLSKSDRFEFKGVLQ